MEQNKKILKKVSKKNKLYFSDQIPHEVRLLDAYIQGDAHADHIFNLSDILACFNIKCL